MGGGGCGELEWVGGWRCLGRRGGGRGAAGFVGCNGGIGCGMLWKERTSGWRSSVGDWGGMFGLGVSEIGGEEGFVDLVAGFRGPHLSEGVREVVGCVFVDLLCAIVFFVGNGE